ncbi:hypothetical protein CRYUN_Cryun16bG0055200 [Craigia yunnanensis]
MGIRMRFAYLLVVLILGFVICPTDARPYQTEQLSFGVSPNTAPLLPLGPSKGIKDVADGRCCKNHPKLGRCLPGHDDDPKTGGKCWNYCIQECRGGFCKKMSNGRHQCHCYC